MDGIYLTRAELEIISRCSGVAVKAYLRLRARMDIRTGLVGQKSGMSYQALREWTEESVEKGSGEMLLQPSMRTIRTAVEQLCRRGLLVRMRTEKLVFRCALADLAEPRSKRTRHEPDRAKQPEPDTEPDTNPTGLEASNGAGFGGVESAEPDTEPDTNPTGQNRPNPTNIGVGVNPSLPQAASTAVNGVDAEAAVAAVGLAMMWQQPPQPDDELSRRATALAVALRSAGLQGINSANPRLRGWAEAGASPAQVVEALHVARKRREGDGSHQPIGAGYLDPILRDILNPPKRKAADAWWVSVQAMDAKARELGIATARAGESEQDYKGRIRAALLSAEARQA